MSYRASLASLPASARYVSRAFSTSLEVTATPSSSSSFLSSSSTASSDALPPPNTHYKITLRRSAIALGEKKQATLVSLGIHRRFQTVYFRHSPEVAGKILKVKELLEVENVPEQMVRTKEEMRRERMAKRGYKVIGSKRGIE